MDDGIILHNDKEYLKECLNKIKLLLDKYKLKLNDKTKIDNIKNGIEFLGYRFYKNNKVLMKVNNKTKRRFKCSKSINYKGYLLYGNCKGLIYSILK